MSVSKIGISELNSSIDSTKTRVQTVKDSILSSLDKRDFKGFSEVSRVHGAEFHALAGMTSLKSMVESGTLKHVTTGKMRLYRGIFMKTTNQQNFVRFLREAIAEEYKNEWSDILDPEEGFALVNPNQRARHGILLYSVSIVATEATYRYLRILQNRVGDSMRFNVHPVVISPENTAESRMSLLPKGGFDVYGDYKSFNLIPLDAMIQMTALMLEAMRLTIESLKDGKLTYSVYGPEQLVAVCKKEFVNPSLKVKGVSLVDVQTKYRLTDIPPATLANRFNRLFQAFYPELEKLAGLHRIPKKDQAAVLDESKVMKVCTGVTPYVMAYQVDVSVPGLYNNGSAWFSNRASVYREVVKDLGAPSPVTHNDAFRSLTGIDVSRWSQKLREGSGSVPRDARALVTSLEMPMSYQRTMSSSVEPHTPGGVLSRCYSSKNLADTLSGFLTVFRTLMRKNIWLNLK